MADEARIGQDNGQWIHIAPMRDYIEESLHQGRGQKRERERERDSKTDKWCLLMVANERLASGCKGSGPTNLQLGLTFQQTTLS